MIIIVNMTNFSPLSSVFVYTAAPVQEPARGFSQEMVVKLKEFFETEVSTLKRPTLARCRQFLIKHNISNKTDKQVQDKVHTLNLAKKRSKV